MNKETFEEFQERMGFKLDNEDANLNLAILIYFSTIYSYEQKLNWRRQIVKIKQILNGVIENQNKVE
jgi:hypothetical protein